MLPRDSSSGVSRSGGKIPRHAFRVRPARQRYSGDGVWRMDHSAARARRHACHVATDPRHGSIKVEVIFLFFLTHFYSRFYSFTFPITSLISLAFFFLFISLVFIIVLFSLPCHSCYSVISLFCSDLFPLSKVTLVFVLFITFIYKLDLF